MANVPRGAPKGKKSLERFEDVIVDDLTATNAAISKIGLDDDGSTKIGGLVSTRNEGDTSMYIPVASAAGTERGMKVAYAPSANGGGYFDSLYVNTKTTGTATGEYRAIEAKTTVASNLAAGAIAQGVYAKINVSGASNEVAHAIGVDILLEEEDSGTITQGTGVRVAGGLGVVTNGVDLSAGADQVGLKLPYGTAAGVAVADLAAKCLTGVDAATAGASGLVGIYKNSSDSKMYLVAKVEGRLGIIEIADAS